MSKVEVVKPQRWYGRQVFIIQARELNGARMKRAARKCLDCNSDDVKYIFIELCDSQNEDCYPEWPFWGWCGVCDIGE